MNVSINSRLDDYVVLSTCGEGSFGKVYKCSQKSENMRHVALKLIPKKKFKSSSLSSKQTKSKEKEDGDNNHKLKNGSPNLRSCATDLDMKPLRMEISILRQVKHKNIIELYDAFETEKNFFMITEFAKSD